MHTRLPSTSVHAAGGSRLGFCSHPASLALSPESAPAPHCPDFPPPRGRPECCAQRGSLRPQRPLSAAPHRRTPQSQWRPPALRPAPTAAHQPTRRTPWTLQTRQTMDTADCAPKFICAKLLRGERGREHSTAHAVEDARFPDRPRRVLNVREPQDF